jgi:hypothetical protein
MNKFCEKIGHGLAIMKICSATMNVIWLAQGQSGALVGDSL